MTAYKTNLSGVEKSEKHIVVSAVNIRKGGTLTVLRDCLKYLSAKVLNEGTPSFKVTAIVHDKSLCLYPGIEYIEMPWSAKSWLKRLKCEYITLKNVSRNIQPVDLWFSLHDTTPRVQAKRQAVYCHTSFPFMKSKFQDFRMDYKIMLFSKLTKYAYRYNVKKNRFVVVQQQWMREALSKLLSFKREDIIVAPPSFEQPHIAEKTETGKTIFLYPSTADCHKNFETLCKASAILEGKLGRGFFSTVITVSGSENKYAKWLYGKYGDLESLDFHGFMKKEELMQWYANASCLVFPSRIETWGLPISEFKPTGKPMILADLPYAHETSAGAREVAFFSADNAEVLADRMLEVIQQDRKSFTEPPVQKYERPTAASWEELFGLLLENL